MCEKENLTGNLNCAFLSDLSEEQKKEIFCGHLNRCSFAEYKKKVVLKCCGKSAFDCECENDS